jgi:hypothetical protein
MFNYFQHALTIAFFCFFCSTCLASKKTRFALYFYPYIIAIRMGDASLVPLGDLLAPPLLGGMRGGGRGNNGGGGRMTPLLPLSDGGRNNNPDQWHAAARYGV